MRVWKGGVRRNSIKVDEIRRAEASQLDARLSLLKPLT